MTAQGNAISVEKGGQTSLIDSLVEFICYTLHSSSLLLKANSNRERAGEDSAAAVGNVAPIC